MRALVLVLVMSFGASSASCIDPVHGDAVAALGPEAAGVRTGPTHRPGQPCLTCHGGDGPGPDFAVAGTVYTIRGGSEPLVGGRVTLTDATNVVKEIQTNQVGNFYLESNRWTPVYPIHVLVSDGTTNKEMVTRIGRTGGCAYCHRGAGDNTQMPGVYLKEK